MLVNGSFTLVDAYFLGEFVGASALTAVTSMFPAFMMIVALSTLVSNGFASVMARLLGGGESALARNAFAQAITLSLLVCAILLLLFWFGGREFALLASNGDKNIAEMSYTYMAILIVFSPLGFVLAINGDSLRCEGHIAFMAMVSLLSVLLNGVFNYVLIVPMNMGVAGSAYGTILAQLVSIIAMMFFRMKHINPLNLSVARLSLKTSYWKSYLALGAPSSLSYVGLALSSAATLYNLQVWNEAGYDTTVAAFGINTRLMTFVFLPLLGLSMAFQTILGNNVGAKNWRRANGIIKIALWVSLIYSLVLQLIAYIFRGSLGEIFVSDAAIVAEVSRILPFTTMALCVLGPQLILTMFFQATGDAKRAGLLGLVKTYLFVLPLLFLLPYGFGEWGVWYASPLAEGLGVLLAITILFQRNRKGGHPFGLFYVLDGDGGHVNQPRLSTTDEAQNGLSPNL
jgi:putative MATE family efflux protein